MLAPCPDLLAFVLLHRVVQVRLSALPMGVWAASYLGGLALAPPTPNGALSASLVLCGCGLESSRPALALGHGAAGAFQRDQRHATKSP